MASLETELSSTHVDNDSATQSPDDKIMKDLKVVKEKMELCDGLLHPGAGAPAPSLLNDHELLTVVGFLEACQPRMVELVEVAAQGALKEAAFMECLSVNDRLTKLLSDVDTAALTETTASTTAAAASKEDVLSDLLQSSTAIESHGNTTAATNDLKAPPDSVPAAAKSDDEFDSFFNERTGGKTESE